MKFFFSKPKSKITEVKLNSSEEDLLHQVNYSKELALAIKSKTNGSVEGLYELQMFNHYVEGPKLRGIKSILDEEVNIPSMLSMVKHLQSDSNLKEYHIFSAGHYGSDKDYFLGAIKTSDQLESLRVFETNGINYNLQTKDIIEFLDKWHRQVNFSVLDV
jgi:hypothetical protein